MEEKLEKPDKAAGGKPVANEVTEEPVALDTEESEGKIAETDQPESESIESVDEDSSDRDTEKSLGKSDISDAEAKKAIDIESGSSKHDDDNESGNYIKVPVVIKPDVETAKESDEAKPAAVPLALPAGERPPIVDHTRKPRHRKRLALIIFLALVIIAAGGAAGYYLANKKIPASNPVVTSSKTTTKQSASVTSKTLSDEALTKFTTPTTGETWLATPEQVGDLGYFNAQGNTTMYYQVGMHGQNTIYMGVMEEAGYFIQLFEKTPDGSVSAIEYPSSTYQYDSSYSENYADNFAKSVMVNTTTHYDSISIPGSFSIGNDETVTYGAGSGEIGLDLTSMAAAPTSGVTRTTVASYGGSKLVRVEHQYTDTGLTAANYVIDLPIGTEVNLSYTPISKDLSTYSWDNGTNVASTTTGTNGVSSMISGIVRGCGSAETSVSWDYQAQDSDFVAAGKTSTGQTVYTFASNSNPIVQKAYTEYTQFFAGTTGVTVVPLDTFLKDHAIVAYKNGAGQWLVYTRDQYAAVGGCAKPVVYLYPTKAEHVTVRVGAYVTKSDPSYDLTTGWNVYAQPSGQLTVGGAIYGSLFWEGQGMGFYPAITSGTIVKRSDALATIKSQLAEQGLRPNEINDFVAYWGSKIPNDPYIRLTWFNTAQMNELATLFVSPAPDTLIRVFLDMDGYAIPPNLPAQHLSSVPRKGFTVVEWGGLSQSALQ